MKQSSRWFALASSVFAFTLAACPDFPECDTEPVDADEDGSPRTQPAQSDVDPYVCAEVVDCDDTDASIHPGAEDAVGDGVDQDCDGADGTAGEGEGE